DDELKFVWDKVKKDLEGFVNSYVLLCINICKDVYFQNSSYICGDERLGPKKLLEDFSFLTKSGELILSNVSLSVGIKLDHFSSEFGKYLSPIHIPYNQRALPPSNLNIKDTENFPYNYHMYEVIKSFIVLAGLIRG
ncbi:3009_t:CDS:2, partial [Scutellospora calospora]